MSHLSRAIGTVQVLAPHKDGGLTEIQIGIYEVEDQDNYSTQYVIDNLSFQILKDAGAFRLKPSAI